MTKELFLEIGTEEIPAGFLPKAMADIESLIRRELESTRLDFTGIKTLATPRRMALCVTGLPSLQPDAEITALGPAKSGFLTDIITTLSYTLDVLDLQPIPYVTVNSNDAISLYGSISVVPTAGSLDISEASIVAIKLFDQTV